MTMHAALNRGSMADSGEAFSFANLSLVEAPVSTPAIADGGYGHRSGPNWVAIAIIVGFHMAALLALVKLDIISVQKPKTSNLVVFDIAAPAPPPMEKPQPEKVVEKIVPEVITPVAVVQTLAPPPPPIQVTNTPPPPKQIVVAQAAPPAGPVAVTNLDEHLISGNPPKYPMESRRKKEQGTVVLRLVIGIDGRVQDISIAQSSGFDRLDTAALSAVRGWRWQPVLQAGNPVAVRGLLPIPFVIAGKA